MTRRMLHHLPVGAYTEWERFRREQEMIFSRTWVYAGFVEDVPGPGRYISVQAGLNNIFVVMGRDHRLRAFHNLCRHRGTQLLRTVDKVPKTITCPYHGWTYDLEGRLRSIPGEKPEFRNVDKARLGLKPASVGCWRGMLFVHPEPHAGSITEWFEGVEPYLGPHEVHSLIEYRQGRASYEIKANWKIVVENYIDWDRLFGTIEREEELATYVLTTPINTINPLKVQFYEVIHLWRVARRRDGKECGRVLEVCVEGAGVEAVSAVPPGNRRGGLATQGCRRKWCPRHHRAGLKGEDDVAKAGRSRPSQGLGRRHIGCNQAPFGMAQVTCIALVAAFILWSSDFSPHVVPR